MSLERVKPIERESGELLVQHRARYDFAGTYVAGKTVLDVACGMGYGAEILMHSGAASVTGMDISADAIEYATENYRSSGITFLQGDAESLTGISTVDVITSFETIEHLQNPGRFLEAVRLKLNAGGTFIISTPIRTKGSLDTKPDNPFHVREWSETEFLDLLHANMKITQSFYQFVFPKKWFPGSRTLAKTAARILAPGAYASYSGFPVVQEQPSLCGIPVVKGFLIVVCRI